ncbi:hypothetical protein [Piscirickettsia litoralis]|uniref:hypothetical protein n=1 Tax=Piscirickettsia litoralis TaxID=1891921 RepID=UPI001112D0FB|nr:hypothetical protein [Piscirickettsia litoralis]
MICWNLAIFGLAVMAVESSSFAQLRGGFYVDLNSLYFDSTWEGFDECDEARGEIDGALDEQSKEGELCGTIAFWGGDESEYRAVRLS